MNFDLFTIPFDKWPKRHLTREDFGIPKEFICDGCTSSPDWSWSNPCCENHDMGYFRGGPENINEFMTLKAIEDKQFLWALLHNAEYDVFSPGGTERVGYWKRKQRKFLAYMMYYTGVDMMTQAVKSFRSRPEGRLPAYPDPKFVETAIKAGKWRVIENETRQPDNSDSHSL